MIYLILCGIMGIVFTILLYCLCILNQKRMRPQIDVVFEFDNRVDDITNRGSEIAKNLEAQQVTIDNLEARIIEIDNLVARPLVADMSDKEAWEKWLFQKIER